MFLFVAKNLRKYCIKLCFSLLCFCVKKKNAKISKRKHFIIKLKNITLLFKHYILKVLSNDILVCLYLPRYNLLCAGEGKVDNVCVFTRNFLTDCHIQRLKFLETLSHTPHHHAAGSSAG